MIDPKHPIEKLKEAIGIISMALATWEADLEEVKSKIAQYYVLLHTYEKLLEEQERHSKSE